MAGQQSSNPSQDSVENGGRPHGGNNEPAQPALPAQPAQPTQPVQPIPPTLLESGIDSSPSPVSPTLLTTAAPLSAPPPSVPISDSSDNLSFLTSSSHSTIYPSSSQQSTSETIGATPLSGTAIPSNNSGPNTTGLIAGISVVGALFVLSILVILFLCLRKKRTKDPEVKYSEIIEPETKHVDSSVSNLEATVATLETQLHEKDTQLRESQAALLQHGRRTSALIVADQNVLHKFELLNDRIRDWVALHLKKIKASPNEISADIHSLLTENQSGYIALLKNTKTAPFVVRGLIADLLVPAFTTGQLLGNEAFSDLKQTIGVKSSATELNEWRALTARLLETSSRYQSDRTDAVEAVSRRLDSVSREIVGWDHSEARYSQLEDIVELAATIALELAKLRPLYKLEWPRASSYDAKSMEVINEAEVERIEGAQVKCLVFPAISKWGNESGTSYERHTTIQRAKVFL